MSVKSHALQASKFSYRMYTFDFGIGSIMIYYETYVSRSFSDIDSVKVVQVIKLCILVHPGYRSLQNLRSTVLIPAFGLLLSQWNDKARYFFQFSFHLTRFLFHSEFKSEHDQSYLVKIYVRKLWIVRIVLSSQRNILKRRNLHLAQNATFQNG